MVKSCLNTYILNHNINPLEKAPGPDKISLKVTKDCLPVILKPLSSIINATFTSQVYPSLWKKAEIVPIPKASNNRPISLLPILSKVSTS